MSKSEKRARKPAKPGKPAAEPPTDTTEPAGPAWSGLGLANLLIFLAAVAVIVFAYVWLDRGSVTAAPLLLVFGYMVLLPASILWGYRRT